MTHEKKQMHIQERATFCAALREWADKIESGDIDAEVLVAQLISPPNVLHAHVCIGIPAGSGGGPTEKRI